MRSLHIGVATVSIVAVLTFVASVSYRNRTIEPALPVATAGNSLPLLTIADSDTGHADQSARLIAADFQTKNVTQSKPAAASTGHQRLMSACGPGLAAEDLAGQCRTKPCPTMGALEASDASAAASAEPICLTDSIKPNMNNGTEQSIRKKRKTSEKQRLRGRKIDS